MPVLEANQDTTREHALKLRVSILFKIHYFQALQSYWWRSMKGDNEKLTGVKA